jgi:dTDP-D-glucose 4,6-dehydratase
MRILYTKGRPINRLIYVSTDEVLGDSTLLPFREPHDHTAQSNQLPLSLNPTNPYAASKAAAECIVRAYQISFNLPIVIVRSSNVYGPRQYPVCKIVPPLELTTDKNRKKLYRISSLNPYEVKNCWFMVTAVIFVLIFTFEIFVWQS